MYRTVSRQECHSAHADQKESLAFSDKNRGLGYDDGTHSTGVAKTERYESYY